MKIFDLTYTDDTDCAILTNVPEHLRVKKVRSMGEVILNDDGTMIAKLIGYENAIFILKERVAQ